MTTSKKTGVILVTHPEIGRALLNIAKRIMPDQDVDITLVDVAMDKDCNTAKKQLAELIQANDKGQGVLILNDVFGATPFNIANAVLNEKTKLISGLNLSMLLRAITYQTLPLEQLAEKTRDGGLNGVRLLEK